MNIVLFALFGEAFFKETSRMCENHELVEGTMEVAVQEAAQAGRMPIDPELEAELDVAFRRARAAATQGVPTLRD